MKRTLILLMLILTLLLAGASLPACVPVAYAAPGPGAAAGPAPESAPRPERAAALNAPAAKIAVGLAGLLFATLAVLPALWPPDEGGRHA